MLFLLRLDQKKPYRYYLCFWGALSCHVRNLTTSRTDADAPLLWPPDVKSQLIGKDSDAGKDWGQEEKGMTEDEMVWMASPTQWTWVWANFGRWWRIGKPGMQVNSKIKKSFKSWIPGLHNQAQINLQPFFKRSRFQEIKMANCAMNHSKAAACEVQEPLNSQWSPLPGYSDYSAYSDSLKAEDEP